MRLPEERVAILEQAFYGQQGDRQRMAALLNRASELVLEETEAAVPNDFTGLHLAEQERLARYLRKYAQELVTTEDHEPATSH